MLWIESELRFASKILNQHSAYCQGFLKNIEALLAKEFEVSSSSSTAECSVEDISFDIAEVVASVNHDEEMFEAVSEEMSGESFQESVGVPEASWFHTLYIDAQLEAQTLTNPVSVFGPVTSPRRDALFARTNADWLGSLRDVEELHAFEQKMGYNI